MNLRFLERHTIDKDGVVRKVETILQYCIESIVHSDNLQDSAYLPGTKVVKEWVDVPVVKE